MGLWARTKDFMLMRGHQSEHVLGRMEQRASAPKSISGMVPMMYAGRPTWWTDNIPVLTREAYRKTVTAFACINIIADAVAEATLRVWMENAPGDEEELPLHPLRQLMRSPHPRYSESEFIAQMVRMAGISGFVVVEKVRSNRGNVVQLGLLRPDWISPILRDNAEPDWEYRIPSKSGYDGILIKAEDVIVFRYMDDPLLSVLGDTPLRAVLREAGIQHDLGDFVKLVLERGGMPQVALVVDPPKGDEYRETLTDDEREAIRQQFIAKYAGYQNWSGPAILEGMHVETIGLNLNDLAFKDLRDGVALSVCQAFRVPAPVVQVMAGITQSYGKLLEESMALLQDYTASPLRRRLDGALSRSLIYEFDSRPGIDLKFDTSDVKALQENADAVHKRAREAFDSGGMTWDEYRTAIGLEPWETNLGNAVKLPFTTVPTPTEISIAITTSKKSDPESTSEDPDDEDARVERRGDLVYVDEQRLSDVERQARARVAMTHQKLILLSAGLIQGAVGTYLQEQKERVLTAHVSESVLSRSSGLMSVWKGLRAFPNAEYRDLDPVDWTNENQILKEVLRIWWNATAEEGASEAAMLMGVDPDWDGSNPYLQDIEDALARQVVKITEATMRDIEELVLDAVVDGKTDVEIASSISDLFDITYANRHVTIARTEAMVAANTGAQLQYSNSGHVDQVEMRDNGACDHTRGSDGLTCAERNGMVVAVTNMGRHIAGEHPNGSLGFLPILNKPLGEV